MHDAEPNHHVVPNSLIRYCSIISFDNGLLLMDGRMGGVFSRQVMSYIEKQGLVMQLEKKCAGHPSF
jgi:hypothetical protein